MAEQWIGKTLPKITLSITEHEEITLPDDLKGHWTLLYFYPKDDTPGCTKQACGYQAQLETFKKLGVAIYGVSLDDLSSHEKFRKKYHLTFPLISDFDHKLSKKLGVYGPKQYMGKTYQGLNRDTFLIDDTGKIRYVWRKVRPEETVNETANAIRELKN